MFNKINLAKLIWECHYILWINLLLNIHKYWSTKSTLQNLHSHVVPSLWMNLLLNVPIIVIIAQQKPCKTDNVVTSLKFIYSEKATKFCKISTVQHRTNLRWSFTETFVAFSEYMKIMNEFAFKYTCNYCSTKSSL